MPKKILEQHENVITRSVSQQVVIKRLICTVSKFFSIKNSSSYLGGKNKAITIGGFATPEKLKQKERYDINKISLQPQ